MTTSDISRSRCSDRVAARDAAHASGIDPSGELGDLIAAGVTAVADFYDAQARLVLVFSEMQRLCPHPSVIEAPGTTGNVWLTNLGPFRMCEVCGVEEHPSGGFKVLTGNVTRVESNQDLYRRRVPAIELTIIR